MEDIFFVIMVLFLAIELLPAFFWVVMTLTGKWDE